MAKECVGKFDVRMRDKPKAIRTFLQLFSQRPIPYIVITVSAP